MESLLEAHFRSWHVAHPAAHPTTAVSPDRPCRDGNRNRENMADSERLRSASSSTPLSFTRTPKCVCAFEKGAFEKRFTFPNTFLRHESLYIDCLSSPERPLSPSLNRALAGAHAGATLASGLRPDS